MVCDLPAKNIQNIESKSLEQKIHLKIRLCSKDKGLASKQGQFCKIINTSPKSNLFNLAHRRIFKLKNL
jgi:hypothetical protein